MTSVSRQESRRASLTHRAVLLRTAATVLVAASPLLYSGAASAAVGGVQLTAPVLNGEHIASRPLVFSLASSAGTSGFSLNVPIFQGGSTANNALLPGNFQLGAPTLSSASAPQTASFSSQPVQNLLAVPMDAQAGEATISASAFSISTMAATQNYDNSNDITVSDAETAIDINANPDSIVVNNSGDLTGGGGINVSTGDLEVNAGTTVYSYSFGWNSEYSSYLYDNYGNKLGSSWYDRVTTADVYTSYNLIDVNANQSDASITIGNSGNIDFSGYYGITANNPAGDSITITNSGDITATSDTLQRVGIYANTTAPSSRETVETEITPGDFTFNSYGQLTGVNTTGEYTKETTIITPTGDVGAVTIENAGIIDMGTVDVSFIPPGYTLDVIASQGIAARSAGDVNIVNQAGGAILVSDFSQGISVAASADVAVRNDGSIEIGNQSSGIFVATGPLGSADTYTLGGDISIINTGDISGGLTLEEALASPNFNAFFAQSPAKADGIQVYALGTNRDYYGFLLHFAQGYELYGSTYLSEYLAEYRPELKLTTTTIVNEGGITLKDGGLGIYASQVYGEVRAYNAGMITVGNGNSDSEANFDFRAIGIYMNNLPSSGYANFYAKNEAGGIIVTGDDAAGIWLQSPKGSLTAINEGTIIVGDGDIGPHTNYNNGEVYDWLTPSAGMAALTGGIGFAQTTIAINSGDITVGDLGTGILVSGYSNFFLGGLFDPYRITAAVSNSGDVTVGDNATGIRIQGNNVVTVNDGTVTVGDKDLSGYRLGNPNWAGTIMFNNVGFGIKSTGLSYSGVVNNGAVTTGNNTIGIYNGAPENSGHFNFVTTTVQGESGIISTGDDSIGMKTHSGQYNNTYNYGTISVGDNSVGIEATAGFHYTQLIDSIQYGGCHKLNYNGGAGCTADTITTGYYYEWSYPYTNFVGRSRTDFTQEVSRPGIVSVNNAGIIETGDNSVGVRVAGVAGLDYEHFRYVSTPNGYGGRYNKRTRVTGEVETDSYVFFRNSGTIRVGANSTAVEITGKGLPNGYGYAPQMINYGAIDAGQGYAIKANVDTGIDSRIYNAGTIIGDILFGDGNDLLLNAQDVDPATGQVASTGNIIMDGHTIDFGGGENTFAMNRGAISVTGGNDNLITGDNLTVVMNYGEIDARDDFIIQPASSAAATLAAVPFADPSWFSTLTIDGDVSGNFRFATDVDQSGASDELVITGNVADGSEIGVILNPVEQLKGAVEFRPINIKGTNGADVIEVAGASGIYADSLIGSEAHYEASTGDVVINATFGLGHMGTAANAAAVSAQNWLTGSLSSFGDRNIHAYTGRKGDGLAVWGYAFQDEGEIRPDSDLQDLSFRQITSGLQAGVQWTKDVSGGRVSVSPMFTYGTAEANLIANTASSRSHPWAVGLNANYVMDGGLYVDATYQRMKMDVDLKTPGTITQATGETSIDGQGFNLEAGYSHKLKSGLVLEPQLQLTHTKIDVDDFASSDGIYNLTDIDGKATTVRAGLSVYKVFETNSGSITPLASLSYLNTLNGDTELASNGVGFDSDTSGMGYQAEIGVLGRHYAWDFGAKLGFSNTEATGSILQPSLHVRYAFGADAAKAAPKTAVLPEITEATVKFADSGSATAAPMATAASAEFGAPVVSSSYARTGAEPTEQPEDKEAQPVQSAPELDPEQAPATPEEAGVEHADIVVTGSLIARGANPEISPVTVITSEEMATKGLLTLGDVMNSFTQNDGFTQGKASNLLGRFTHGAEEVNFRGLGTGRTLVLVNGRRIADYPLPFGGEQNGADLGAIPFSAIANVQYLSSGASATYGSDAVGGVVNIITKRDMEQTAVDLTAGIFQEGFGQSLRLSAITGNSYAKGSFTLGGEFVFSDEILASDSNYLRKNAPFEAGMVSLLENTASGMNSVVPQSACAPLGFEFDSASDECVAEISDTISLSPSYKKVSGFFDGRYDLTDDIELFATGMAAKSWTEARSNVLFWQGVVGNDDGSAAMFITRGFSEDELGISKVNVDSTMLSGVLGAKGDFEIGGRAWYWDVALSSSWYDLTQSTRNLKEEGIKNWILAGASSVTDSPDQRYTYFVDPDFYNNQLVDNVVRPVQPSDVDALVGDNVMKANASASTLSATFNGEIGDLGFLYKPAKVAFRTEYGRQKTEINPDERSLNTSGEGWYNIGSIQSKGTRDRWAVAGEIDATVLSNLDVMLAARYDHYDDASSVKGRVTGQAKFLYRPTDWLKIRGGYGQTFRAPDMFNIYGETDAFEFVPDYSQPGCFDGVNYSCGFTQVASTRRADPNLTEEHGDDIGLGAIFNPLPNFTVTLDWYRIKLKDLVITESSADLMLKEWQCDNGVLDGSSQLCADVQSRVIRNGFGAVERVIVQPINQDNLTRQGIDLRAQYRFESEDLGAFTFDLGYSKVLKFELKRFEGDEPLDLKYGEPGASQPGDGLSAGLSWYQPLTTGKAVSAGVFVQRQGRVKNFDHSQFLEPFYDVNLTVGYQLNTKTQARFTVNNLLDADPVPNGSNIWPGYWAHLQSAFGRSFAISIGHSFN